MDLLQIASATGSRMKNSPETAKEPSPDDKAEETSFADLVARADDEDGKVDVPQTAILVGAEEELTTQEEDLHVDGDGERGDVLPVLDEPEISLKDQANSSGNGSQTAALQSEDAPKVVPLSLANRTETQDKSAVAKDNTINASDKTGRDPEKAALLVTQNANGGNGSASSNLAATRLLLERNTPVTSEELSRNLVLSHALNVGKLKDLGEPVISIPNVATNDADVEFITDKAAQKLIEKQLSGVNLLADDRMTGSHNPASGGLKVAELQVETKLLSSTVHSLDIADSIQRPFEAGRSPTQPLQFVATPTQPTLGSDIRPSAVTYQIAQAMSASEGHDFELRLDPVELGKVRITMIARDGQMFAHITAERPETLELLRKNSDQLEMNFSESGFSETNLSFEDGGETQKEDDVWSNEHATHQVVVDDDMTGRSPVVTDLGAGLDIRL